jgi:hypothetical protein
MTRAALAFATTIAVLAPPGSSIEQTSHGSRPPLPIVAQFDGLGGRNPSDKSLAVGPRHVFQIVNSRFAIYTRGGETVFGPAGTNGIFAGMGGVCEARPNGDAVVRYDQIARRWLVVMPIFRRTEFAADRSAEGAPAPPGQAARPSSGRPAALPAAPPLPRAAAAPAGERGSYAICYAVSTGDDPLGPYHRYAFERTLFPDYPRPAVWPDGYYVPSSTSDDFIQKHACVVERPKMLAGLPAREQCIVIDGVNFLNNADIDGQGLPPAGAPNVMIAAGGAQLNGVLDDDGVFAWAFHVDWDVPARTTLTGPVKIAVAPYRYLCGGQLTNCVPQPGTDKRLDAQGDKIMARLVYRRLGGHESLVAVHSVDTAAGGGGVRWYEFRLGADRRVALHQQGTFAPDRFFRWMASPAMDGRGNIAIGYSFGGTPNFAGQRFAARLAADPPGVLTFRETVLVEGEASQEAMRWEDYTQTAMDPADDCTIWYVGDYLKKGASEYSTRIGAFRIPGCGS